MFLLCVVCSFLFTTASAQDNGTTTVYLTDSNSSYTWSTPDPYIDSESLVVEADYGYRILVTVTKCDIAGDDGDYLLIKSGSSLEDDGNGRVFTYNLDTERQYLVDSNKVFVNFVVSGDNDNDRSGATVVFQRYGEQATTTPEPSTTIGWPTPSANDSIYLTVNVSGYADIEYNNSAILSNLTLAISQMATEYCTTNLFPLTENISDQNVHINQLIQCPYYWPNQGLCVRIRFSLPVFLNDSYVEWSGYQMNSTHLEAMWTSLAENYLNQYGFSLYEVPDQNYTLLIWSLSIMGVVMGFALFLFIVRYITISASSSEKSSLSDTSSIRSKKRDSNLSLTPHPLQSTPQLFENDYPMYEPGFSVPPYADYGMEYAADNQAFTLDESEDEIDTVHFTRHPEDGSNNRESET